MKHEIDKNRISQIKKVTWIGLFINVALAAIKFIFGFIGSSQAVIADAVHSLSDMATDLSVILGVQYWSAPPDENHPYGHLKIESIVTVLIGATLALVALGMGYGSLATIREVHIKQTAWIAVIGPILSIILKEALYRWTVIVGTRARSSAVIANAWHHRSDALSSVPALIAVTASAMNPEWAFLDHVGALIISIFILKISWDIMKPSLAELSDRGASRKDCDKIEKIAVGVGGVRSVHAIRTRKCGQSIFVDLHVVVDPEISVRLGHNISEEVKKSLMKEGPKVFDVVSHIEPDE